MAYQNWHHDQWSGSTYRSTKPYAPTRPLNIHLVGDLRIRKDGDGQVFARAIGAQKCKGGIGSNRRKKIHVHSLCVESDTRAMKQETKSWVLYRF